MFSYKYIIQTVSAKQEKCGNLKPTFIEFLDRKHFHLKTVTTVESA
jgi:hypothetical protein